MLIDVQCFATLASHSPKDGSLDVEEGTRIDDLLASLEIPIDEVRLVFINGKNRPDWSCRIQEADRVGIFPPVGGG
ncbi:MoaD/ThiS family protein [Desulfoplanes sp.]